MAEFSAMVLELRETFQPIMDFLAASRIAVNMGFFGFGLYFLAILVQNNQHQRRFLAGIMGILCAILGGLYGGGLVARIDAVETKAAAQISQAMDEMSVASKALVRQTGALYRDGYAIAEDDGAYASEGGTSERIGYVLVTCGRPAQIHDEPFSVAPSNGQVQPAELIPCYGVAHSFGRNASWYLVTLETGESGFLLSDQGQLFVEDETPEPEAVEAEEAAAPQSHEGWLKPPGPSFG